MSEPEAKLGYVGEWPAASLISIECASEITDLTVDDHGQLIVVTETGMTRLSAEDLR